MQKIRLTTLYRLKEINSCECVWKKIYIWHVKNILVKMYSTIQMCVCANDNRLLKLSEVLFAKSIITLSQQGNLAITNQNVNS